MGIKVRKETKDRKIVVRAKPDNSLRALIASRRKEHVRITPEKVAGGEGIEHIEIVYSQATEETMSKEAAEERQFDGGFFLISSPNSVPCPRQSPVLIRSPVVTRSVGRMRRDTSRRISGLLSPFVSNIGKINVQGGSSIVNDNIKSRLFEDVEEGMMDEKEVDPAIADKGLLASVCLGLKLSGLDNLGASAS